MASETATMLRAQTGNPNFSRLQLAAALIEYDNDNEDGVEPPRSAHDSAIFAHLRQMPRLPPVKKPAADYLSIKLPSDQGSLGGRESALSHFKGRNSVASLVNPFATGSGADEEEAEEDEHAVEVDLASWGLDSFMPKEKPAKGGKKKEKMDVLPNPYDQPADKRRIRSMSVGTSEAFGAGGAFLESPSATPPPTDRHNHKRSMSSTLDLASGPNRPVLGQRTVSAHGIIEAIPTTPPLHSIPFPADDSRSRSPSVLDVGSSFDPRSKGKGRTYSTASIGSKGLLADAEEELMTMRRSSAALSVQPDERRARTTSMGTVGSLGSRALLAEDNPFALRPPSPARTSRFDPKAAAHARTMSNLSLGSRIPLDNPETNDAASVMTGQQQRAPRPQMERRPYSTLELMRPKVLVMPSPLQGTVAAQPAPGPQPREGFQWSADGPPVPLEARGASRRASSINLLEGISPPPPVASNGFTPNPRSSMTLSQLTFRNQLMVGGQRDVAYSDLDAGLQRATEEGQQIVAPVEEEPVRPLTVVVNDEDEFRRPAGKLYGVSLIDAIESRKANMRSRQRVFTGDDRPSMMARQQTRSSTAIRSSTFIDPESLNRRASQLPPGAAGARPPLGRRASTGAKPLLDFGDVAPANGPGLQHQRPAMTGTKSVFGVDTLWEREMAKLREIEAQEAAEEEARRAAELVEAARQEKKKGKGKKKKKDKGREEETVQPQDNTLLPEAPALSTEDIPRASVEPPVLPAIPRNITRGPPPPRNEFDEDSESASDESEAPGVRLVQGGAGGDGGDPDWHAGSSDDEKKPKQVGPVRTTGVGPRYPNRARGRPGAAGDGDDSSDSDVPLSATVDRVLHRSTTKNSNLRPAADESDEEKPLSVFLDKAKLNIPSIDFDNIAQPSTSRDKGKQVARNGDDEDEDNEPLGIRASRMLPGSIGSPVSGAGGGDDEDDKPLGLHPEQQRRTQYQQLMYYQQQQQVAQQQQIAQQQMMQAQMQAQMHQSMIFGNPSMMGSGFFGPPVAAPMGAPMPMMNPMGPMPVPVSPPPMQDNQKYGRVDKWRHEVG
ncbi:uncharacterized protein STEHIDRAFT_132161 [Stereum hirsutum FP-91666 SS1]|uniref:uncharacterized protein n=1 Tax=Stereum hirsutum (strain FP-91666) TaxID=721885 RepID=UPI000444A578|nr:uncharacterized protein STEHIDRAFT_132161 [Stereum hirsutum FP-91666 SS1]EIM85637.1 hypothetical protein STEHIDRAFT_132161 [Stereum hirsutum FP-91666 SS1]